MFQRLASLSAVLRGVISWIAPHGRCRKGVGRFSEGLSSLGCSKTGAGLRRLYRALFVLVFLLLTSAHAMAAEPDTTPPVITATVSPSPNASGWNNTNVTVTFQATDSGSGVASLTQPVTITTEGAGQTITGQATDYAGNTATASVTLNTDTTPPGITATVSPPPNANGWNNTNVTVTFQATDSGSGVASVTQPVTFTSEGTSQVTGTATDRAGNTASLPVIVKIDKTPPFVSNLTPTGGSITNRRPTISAQVSDMLSGVYWLWGMSLDGNPVPASCTYPSPYGPGQTGPASISYTPTSDLAAGQHTVVVSGGDWAINSFSTQWCFTVDSTPPVITAAISPSPNISGWNNSNATVYFSATDSGTGVANVTPPVTVTSEGTNWVTGTATDYAGNMASTMVAVKIDKSSPSIMASVSPSPNMNGWNNSDVWVYFYVSDSFSGVANVSSPVHVTSEGTGWVTGTATDYAGNMASTSVTVKIDRSLPSITASVSPSPNMNGWNNTNVTVSFQATDNGSGVASVTCPVTVSMEGSMQMITGIATDRAGNTASSPVTLKIDKTPPYIYNLTPFSGSVTARRPTISAQVSDSLSGVCSLLMYLDGNSVPATCNWPVPYGPGYTGSASISYTPTSDLFLGQHTVVVSGSDWASNSFSTQWSFTVDSTPPVITATVSPQSYYGGWINSNATVYFSATDSGTGVAYVTPPVTVTSEGTSQVFGTATDFTGNTASLQVTVRIDKTPPYVFNLTPTGGSITDRRPTISAQASDMLSGVYWFQMNLDGNCVSANCSWPVPYGPGQTGPASISYTPTSDLASGQHTVVVSGGDWALNSFSTQWSFTVASPPAITSATTAGGSAGTAFSYQITASNSPTTYGATGLPFWASFNSSTGAITGTPTTVGTTTVTISATNAGGTGSAMLSITMAPGAPAKLAFVTQPGNGTGGSNLSTQPVVTVQDAYGNVVTSATNSITLAITNGTGTAGAVLSATTNPLAATDGVAGFSGARIDKAGTNYSLTASAAQLTSATSNTFINIIVGPAAQSTFSRQPGGGPAGTAWDQQPQVTLQDAGGNTVTRTAQDVTLAIQNNPGGGTLSGTTTVALNTATGVATFSGLSVEKAGAGYTLTATGNTLNTAPGVVVSAGFSITPAATTTFVVSGYPSEVTAGTAGSVTVTAQDAFGNTASGYTGTVSFSSTGQAALPANYTFTTGANGDNGTHTSSVTLTTAGTQSITASDIATPGITGTQYNIQVDVGAFTKLQILVPGETAAPGTSSGKTGTPAAETAGNAFNVIVNAVDACWNVVSTVTDTVSISSTDPGAVSPTDTPLESGTKTLTVTLKIVGSGTQTVTASDVTQPAKTPDTCSAIPVNPGAASQLEFTTQPGNGTGGSYLWTKPVVSVQDAYGNTVTSAADSIILAIGDNPSGGTLFAVSFRQGCMKRPSGMW